MHHLFEIVTALHGAQSFARWSVEPNETLHMFGLQQIMWYRLSTLCLLNFQINA